MEYEACLRKAVPVGGKNDPSCPNSVLLLPDKPTTFGRIISPETNVRLLSKNTPLMISRKHATVAFSAGKWTVVDHESLNGVFINGARVEPNANHIMEPGDRLVFGVGIDAHPPEFEYVFELMGRGRKRCAEPHPSSSKESAAKQRKVLTESDVNIQLHMTHPGVGEAVGAAEDKIKKLKTSLEEKEKCYANVVQQLEETEKDLQAKLLDQKATLEQEKHELENALKNLFNEKLLEKEEQLNQQLKSQKESLIAEKEKVEAQLQEELNRKLEEKDKELENQLTQQKEALEQVIAEKEARQNLLRVELDNYKAAQARLQDLEANEQKMESSLQELRQIVESKNEQLLKQQEEAKKAEETARKTIMEQMEDEFTCIICQDLFINSTTLSCAHSFCEYCLQSWLLKKNNCPICRQPVKGRPVRSLVLDNAIVKMVDSMDDETKKRRQVVTQEREELKRASASTRGSGTRPIILNDDDEELGGQADIVAPQQHERAPQNPPRHVRVARVPMVREVRAPAEPRHAPAYQRSNYHYRYYDNRYYGNRDDNHYHGDGYERGAYQRNYAQGTSGGYYPGYGQCHLCGMRGHWANGCPYSQ